MSRKDLGAAFVGALTTLPQAVAYGLIAVSPLDADWAVFGITASIASAILFGIFTGAFGTNPFLISGPRAVTALVLAVGIEVGLDRGYDPETAVVLAFSGIVLAGLFQIVSGVLRLGQIVSYVPVPVLAGFVSASALLVFFSSLPMALGVPDMTVHNLLSGDFGSVSFWALIVSGLAIVINFALEGRLKILPASLAGLVAGTVAYYIGTLIFGMPAGPQVGHIDLAELMRMPILLEANIGLGGLQQDVDIPLLTGITIGLLASFDTVLSNSALSMHNNTDSDANRDLQIHGIANVIMGVFGFLPGSGTLSRSTAVIQAGAQSRAANVGTGVVFCLLLAGLTSVVAALPLWATAGMLVATALQAFDKPTLAKAWGIITRQVPYRRVLIGDVIVTLVVLITALIFDLIVSVGVGVLLAIALFVLGMGRDPVRRVYQGSLVHSKVQRPIRQMEWLQHEGERIGVVEMQGALFFGSSAQLEARARSLLKRGVEYLILDLRHLTMIDSTGSTTLHRLHLMCLEAGGKLLISCIERERRVTHNYMQQKNIKDVQLQRRKRKDKPRWVWLNLEANGVISSVGNDWIFDDTDTALATCEDLLLKRMGRSENAECRGIIANSQLFEGLTRAQIIGLGAYAQRHKVDAGENVFEQGDSGDRVYFLVNGRMDVLIDIPGSSRKRRVSALTEGTLFGEMGLLDGATRSATIRAVRDSTCFSIDAQRFENLKQEQPDIVLVLMRNLNRLLADRLRLANTMISELEQ